MARLIPAHAGKTKLSKFELSLPKAHPRSRGENYLCAALPAALRGSSPLTRGKLSSIGGCIRRVGLIPAHAGKTSPTRQQPATPGAHPRSRGENLEIANPRGEREGSSPLTRGKRAGPVPRPPLARLIPAHAGKTSGGEDRFALPGAHPRSRGENGRRVSLRRAASGSSPLTRGKHAAPRRNGLRSGLIPAHAGKTTPTR